jgi:hypothetical protein
VEIRKTENISFDIENKQHTIKNLRSMKESVNPALKRCLEILCAAEEDPDKHAKQAYSRYNRLYLRHSGM